MYLYGDVCNLLFGKELRSDLVDTYMHILMSPSFRSTCEHDIWCLDSQLVTDIVSVIEARKKKETIKIDEIPTLLENMTKSLRNVLQQLTLDVTSRVRYLIIPILHRYHWYLVVVVSVDK